VSDDAIHEPVTVLLRQTDAKIECTVTWPDEDSRDYDLQSLSMHQAKREIKAWLARDGYRPVDRWAAPGPDGQQLMRHFARPPANDRIFPATR